MSQTRSQIKSNIDANITTNGNEEITGAILRGVLNNMADNLVTEYAGYQYAGVASVDTDPGQPDGKVFYVADQKGAYTNFNNLIIADDEVAILKYDGNVWSKESTGITTKKYVDSSVGDLNQLTTEEKGNLVGAVNEVLERCGEPFRVKQWATNAISVDIPSCMEDIDNTSIPKMDFSITGEEADNYQIIGMIAYEVKDNSGKRLNCWPVCQFTGNGQKTLSVRWMCGGTKRVTVTFINAWVLLKHR